MKRYIMTAEDVNKQNLAAQAKAALQGTDLFCILYAIKVPITGRFRGRYESDMIYGQAPNFLGKFYDYQSYRDYIKEFTNGEPESYFHFYTVCNRDVNESDVDMLKSCIEDGSAYPGKLSAACKRYLMEVLRSYAAQLLPQLEPYLSEFADFNKVVYDSKHITVEIPTFKEGNWTYDQYEEAFTSAIDSIPGMELDEFWSFAGRGVRRYGGTYDNDAVQVFKYATCIQLRLSRYDIKANEFEQAY